MLKEEYVIVQCWSWILRIWNPAGKSHESQVNNLCQWLGVSFWARSAVPNMFGWHPWYVWVARCGSLLVWWAATTVEFGTPWLDWHPVVATAEAVFGTTGPWAWWARPTWYWRFWQPNDSGFPLQFKNPERLQCLQDSWTSAMLPWNFFLKMEYSGDVAGGNYVYPMWRHECSWMYLATWVLVIVLFYIDLV